MGAALGAARYLGYKESDAWFYGVSGMAFFGHSSAEGMCPSYPTDWNIGAAPDQSKAGISHQPLLVPDGDVPKAVKSALEKGLVVTGWSGVVCEQIIVCGYADTPQGETIRYLSPPGGEGQFHPWNMFDDGPCQVVLTTPADDRTLVSMGLRCTIDMRGDPRRLSAGANMAMGSEAFRVTAEWLNKKEVLGGEFSYNVEVWEECRRHAVSFLHEANARLDDERLNKPLDDLARQFETIHGELKAIVDTFSGGVPEGKHDEYAQHLCTAYEVEKKAIGSIEAILTLMGRET